MLASAVVLPLLMLSATDKAFPGTLQRSSAWLDGLTGNRLSGWMQRVGLELPAGSQGGGIASGVANAGGQLAAATDPVTASVDPNPVAVEVMLSQGEVSVRGEVPEQALDAFVRIAQQAGDLAPDFETFPGNAPFGWLDQMVKVIGTAQFSLREGKLLASARQLIVEGESLTPDIASLPQRLQSLLGDGVTVVSRVTPRGGAEQAESGSANTGDSAASDREAAVQRQVELLAESVAEVDFAADDVSLNATQQDVLDQVFEFLFLFPDQSIDIDVHVNNAADGAANQKISETRAAVLLDYLVERGIDASRINAIGSGDVEQKTTVSLSLAGAS